MRRQHNSEDGRDCWKTARERNRIRARFQIRQRVGARQLTVSSDYNHKLMHQILFRIVKGDRSYFSLKFLSENVTVLSSPIPVDHCLRNAQGGILMESMILSRLGFERLQALKQKLESLETCTFMEFAVWVGRCSIVGSMMEGGINPCLRGSLRGHYIDHGSDDKELLRLGTETLKKFLLAVPLSLSSNIVKRVVEMRALEPTQGPVCAICDKETSPNMLLSYGPRAMMFIVNFAFWKDLLDRIFLPSTSQVVICPVCTSKESPCSLTKTDPEKRYRESLDLYLALPAARNTKKGKVKDDEYTTDYWSEAVVPSLGYTQSVRRDKFFTHVERGSFHFVKGCIDRGIDLNLRNEYGQTALFISTWFGYFEIAQLLFESGSDPQWPAMRVSRHYKSPKTFKQQQLIDLFGNYSSDSFIFSIEALSESTSFEWSTLIDDTADHPGAGSFVVDGAIDDTVADRLVSLWEKLPVVESSLTKKEKGVPCSIRGYYCDSLASISILLANTLRQINPDKEIVVFPHMRFLCYKDKGICLARHVDLNRQHPFGNVRSTHSFLLYLFDCEEGGETTLLQDLCRDEIALAIVKPKKSRLLCFPMHVHTKGKKQSMFPNFLFEARLA